jgi:hypothetical protein
MEELKKTKGTSVRIPGILFKIWPRRIANRSPLSMILDEGERLIL